MNMTGHNHSRAKQMNRSLVLQTLLRFGPVARQRIAEITRLTPATITYLTGELIQEGLILERGEESSDRRIGRKSIALGIRPGAAKVLGVHITRDCLELGLLDIGGNLERIRREPLPSPLTESDFLDFVCGRVTNYLDGWRGLALNAVGVGSVGLVHGESGVIVAIESLGLKQLSLGAELNSRLRLPVYVDNNVKTMALAEKLYGCCKRNTDYLYVFIGKGIGAGIMIKDQIHRGGKTGAGELGHITYMPGGEPCVCGNRGCLERYASEAAVLQRLELSDINALVDLADRQDERALAALTEIAAILATGLASFNNVFHFQKIVLAGQLTDPRLPLVDAVREELRQRSFLMKYEDVEVAVSELTRPIGVIGAGALALHHEIFMQGTSNLNGEASYGSS